jgi:3-oxoacyl-[acyl-carrier protein] reductase
MIGDGMDLQLKNKRVLLVGVGHGIGQAIARAYSEEGAKLCLISRDGNVLDSLMESIGGAKFGHDSFVADLMNDETRDEVINKLINSYKYFDIVIHNIGSSMQVKDCLAPLSVWQKVWMLNAGIAIAINSKLLPAMIKNNWGRIIHISSISANTLRGSAAYASAKAYLNAYTTTLGRAVAKNNVVVSAILPGAVAFKNGYWDKTRANNPEKYSQYLDEHQAIGRMGNPEEIASFALFLGSDQASFAIGAQIPVDGGSM